MQGLHSRLQCALCNCRWLLLLVAISVATPFTARRGGLLHAATVGALRPMLTPSIRQTPTADAQPPLRIGMLVRPDTVNVGDPFTLVVTVEVPNGATVQWPVITDSNAVVVMRSPTKVTTEQRGTVKQETAEYALSAWNVGVLSIGLPDITVREVNGVRTVSLREARIVVATVLPGDTSLHVPKPARALFPRHVPWWEVWWPAAVVIAALALLWWLWRRRQTRQVQHVSAPESPYDLAMRDFDRLQRMALVDLGECSRAVALSVEVFRGYLSARIPVATLSCTSHELLTALQDDVRIPQERATSLLLESDVVKFGRRTVDGSRARALQQEARAIVEAVEQAEQARRRAALAAMEAAREKEEAIRARHEDDARRRSRRPKAGV